MGELLSCSDLGRVHVYISSAPAQPSLVLVRPVCRLFSAMKAQAAAALAMSPRQALNYGHPCN